MNALRKRRPVRALIITLFCVSFAVALSLLPPLGSQAHAETDTTTMYRLYNTVSGEHLYTSDVSERDFLSDHPDWNFEGIGWIAPNYGQPAYRLYNPYLGEHLYTLDPEEKDYLVAYWDWLDEGIAFYSADSNQKPMYRMYNPGIGIGQHHFTGDAQEYRSLVSYWDWQDEGIGWYALNDDGAGSVDWSVGRDAFIAEWTGRIDRYLAGSPLAGYGQNFAVAAWNYGVDPRWSPAIACYESGKGLYCAGNHNAWGWTSGYVNGKFTFREFPDWPSGIDAHVAYLGRYYGSECTHEAAAKYCPPGDTWYDFVVKQMARI